MYDCPHCGAQLTEDAKSCPECGSDRDTGWGEAAAGFVPAGYGGEDDFDYDAFVADEFGGGRRASQSWGAWMWVGLALALATMLALALR